MVASSVMIDLIAALIAAAALDSAGLDSARMLPHAASTPSRRPRMSSHAPT